VSGNAELYISVLQHGKSSKLNYAMNMYRKLNSRGSTQGGKEIAYPVLQISPLHL